MERIIPMLEIPQSPEPYKNFTQKGRRCFEEDCMGKIKLQHRYRTCEPPKSDVVCQSIFVPSWVNKGCRPVSLYCRNEKRKIIILRYNFLYQSERANPLKDGDAKPRV